MKAKTSNNGGATAIIGAGSWGTALALLLGEKGVSVRLWGHRQDHVINLQRERENKKYLVGHRFPDTIAVHSSLGNALRDVDYVCMVVPSHVYRAIFIRVLDTIIKEGYSIPVFVSATKGIENESLKTMNHVMSDCLGEKNLEANTGVLSGPSFAKEVAQKVPTAVTIGCINNSVGKMLQNHFSTDFFRVYTSKDLVGLEVSAALKNIIAIAAGICDGLKFGDNARAALITRGLAEMTRFGTAIGADEKTFYGLSGLGDLVLTCTGALSRNRHVGIELGRGKGIKEILEEMSMVAEGVKTTLSVHDLALSKNIEMPILEQVYQIIYQNKDRVNAVKDLLTRDLKDEWI